MIARLALSGCCVGLLVGLFEAALLSHRPRFRLLLKSDVEVSIWFVSPLLDEFVFLLIGLALGLAAVVWTPISARRIAALVATELGAASAFVIYEIVWFDPQPGFQLKIATLGGGFLLGFSTAAVCLRWQWARFESFFNPDRRWPLKLLMKTIIIATGILFLCLVLYFSPVSTLGSPARASSALSRARPNIVLISLDTVRADHLSSYGYSRLTSPNLDRLAQEGTTFENAVAASSWTLASHASIFTGLLPHQHGASFTAPLSEGFLTVSGFLKSRGYQTAGFSANETYGLGGLGMAQGFEAYDDGSLSLRHNLLSTLLGQEFQSKVYQSYIRPEPFDRRDGHEVDQDVFRWLSTRARSPFFLFVLYFDAHDPYLAPPPHEEHFGHIPYDLVRRVASFIDGKPPDKPLSKDERAELIMGYDNCLFSLDEQVAQLLAFLKASPEWSNTIVIITADHGESFGEHKNYGHGWALNWELLHVPLIMIGPGIPANAHIRQIVGTREIFPTVLDLIQPEAAVPGPHSLRRFWIRAPGGTTPDELVVSELANVVTTGTGSVRGKSSISAVTPEWHYIRDSRGHTELFRWSIDPLEQNDLAALPQSQSTLQSLQATLRKVVQGSSRPWRGPNYLLVFGQSSAGNRQDTHLDQEDRDQIGSLPYQ